MLPSGCQISRARRQYRTAYHFHCPTEKQQAELTECVFLGLSQRDYGRVAREFADSFGLSASTVGGHSRPAVPRFCGSLRSAVYRRPRMSELPPVFGGA